MANRNTLHKDKLEDFKQYLNSEGVAYRPGKGAWQILQVLTPEFGWQCIFARADMPEHFTVNDKLMPIVRAYLKEKKTPQRTNPNGPYLP